MILYRITKKQYAHDAWSGNGARLYGGRWNHKGYGAVYVASSISLATLEMLVHLDDEILLNSYTVFSIEIPDKHIQNLPTEHLPSNWREDPAPLSTMDLGTDWLQQNSAIALLVPSSIIPSEYNAIINVGHAKFKECLSTIKEDGFSFDQRLLKG